VSLRSSDGDVDVSAIARENGGGGHKRAAGFSSDLELDDIVAFLCDQVSSQLGS
jgi:phosphoesterase RecJ-like protein